MFVFRLWSPAPSSSVLGTPANVQWTWHGNSNCLLGVATCCQEWSRSAGRKLFNNSFSASARGEEENFERFTAVVNLCQVRMLNALLITLACQEISACVLLEVWAPSQSGLWEMDLSQQQQWYSKGNLLGSQLYNLLCWDAWAAHESASELPQFIEWCFKTNRNQCPCSPVRASGIWRYTLA